MIWEHGNLKTDKDHIHYMIETEPTMSVSKIVNLVKSYTTYHIWERYPNYLPKHFWKEHTFWTDGYFVCSVGNVSEEMLRKYIENQGCKTSGGRLFCTDRSVDRKAVTANVKSI